MHILESNYNKTRPKKTVKRISWLFRDYPSLIEKYSFFVPKYSKYLSDVAADIRNQSRRKEKKIKRAIRIAQEASNYAEHMYRKACDAILQSGYEYIEETGELIVL